MSSEIYTARILKTRGLTGEVKIECADTNTIYQPKDVLFTHTGEHLTVKKYRSRGDGLGFLLFEEINRVEEAQKMVGAHLYRREEDLPKPSQDHYYIKDLVGLQVVDEQDAELGILEEVMTTFANDVYRIHTPSDGTILLPAVKEFILDVDIPRHRMKVRVIEGMQ